MNFFEHQDDARKKTSQLVLLFALAVLTLIIMATLLVAGVVAYATADPVQGFTLQSLFTQMTPRMFALVSLVVITIVGGGSAFKLAQLSGGGKVIATMLGGVRINPNTKDPDERKLLNVVEEMAIASGTPVPPVYLMSDKNINAFAAGFNLNDAVIGVTRGCIEQLNRDELQGVIAHEFSHIVHGDMRINIRLMGILHGILVIGLIGYHLLDKMRFAGRSSSSSKNNGLGAIVALALGLIVIGFGGVFFGNLIKSAISRQREYLADASAVQFTRNPEGIANALKRIGGFPSGAILHGPHVGEASHMFFGEAVRSIFATHPPLAERITRIEPQWNGQFLPMKTASEIKGKEKPKPQTSPRDKLDKVVGAATVAAVVDQALAQIGNPGPEQIEEARQTLNDMPDLWQSQARDKLGARAVIYALLLDSEAAVREHQLQHLRNLDPDTLAIATELAASCPEVAQRLPLVDIALPQLGNMELTQYETFMDLVDALIRADKRISLFEWSLFAILKHYLAPLYGKLKPPQSKYRELDDVKRACQLLFSTLAVAGNTGLQRASAFQAAVEKADMGGLHLLPVEELGIGKLSGALEELNKLYPLAKPKLLKACVACICADGEITPTESELIRAIADTLDCPMPPIKL